MDLDPTPITLTQIDEGDYHSPRAPKPFIVVGTVPATLEGVSQEVTLEDAVLTFTDGLLTGYNPN